MKLATSSLTKKIDSYAERELGIPLVELMRRAGSAVANAVRKRVNKGARVTILAGKGNNGGDGYAAAVELMDEYSVTVYDIFGAGQRTPEGKHFLNNYKEHGGKVLDFSLSDSILADIADSDCIIDAIFGTGFKGEIPDELCKLSRSISTITSACKIAIDVPIGVNADDGSVNMDAACAMTTTVALSYIKPGLVSYPGRGYVGELILDTLGLPVDDLARRFNFSCRLIDKGLAETLIPRRNDNSNKGSFGKLLVITGSKKYRGAAYLAIEAALRGGVGVVSYLGERDLCDSLIARFPEVIYNEMPPISDIKPKDIKRIKELSEGFSAVLVGCGSGHEQGLLKLVKALLAAPGAPLILDADALNVLSDNEIDTRKLLKRAKRPVILTPHPLEFSRLSGVPTADVQLNRLAMARTFAKETHTTLVLKGASTIVTDGESTYINSTGSSALAKAGSGDVLAGLISSVIASGADPLCAAAMSVYYHGAASDSLALQFSSIGVTISELPIEIARQIAKSERKIKG